MASEWAAIVNAMNRRDWLGRRWYVDVVWGTIQRYYPSSSDRSIHWTAAGAKRAGERRIERYERQRYDYLRRQAIARMETGYKEDS